MEDLGEDAYITTATVVRSIASGLLVLVGSVMCVEFMSIAETLWVQRKLPRLDVFDKQAWYFQVLLMLISLANAFTLIWFLLLTQTNYKQYLPCNTLTKLLGTGYVFSFSLPYIFFILRARLAGRMYKTKNYWRWRSLTEFLVAIFVPLILLPIYLASPVSMALDSEGRCLVFVPLHLLIIFLIGNLIISLSVIALFLYPIVAATRESQDLNGRSSRLFLDVARFNAKRSIIAVLSSTCTVITFCILTSIALEGHANDYYVIIAHAISLLDIVGIGFCIRSTIRIWVPSKCRQRANDSRTSFTLFSSGAVNNTASSFRALVRLRPRPSPTSIPQEVMETETLQGATTPAEKDTPVPNEHVHQPPGRRPLRLPGVLSHSSASSAFISDGAGTITSSSAASIFSSEDECKTPAHQSSSGVMPIPEQPDEEIELEVHSKVGSAPQELILV